MSGGSSNTRFGSAQIRRRASATVWPINCSIRSGEILSAFSAIQGMNSTYDVFSMVAAGFYRGEPTIVVYRRRPLQLPLTTNQQRRLLPSRLWNRVNLYTLGLARFYS